MGNEYDNMDDGRARTEVQETMNWNIITDAITDVITDAIHNFAGTEKTRMQWL